MDEEAVTLIGYADTPVARALQKEFRALAQARRDAEAAAQNIRPHFNSTASKETLCAAWGTASEDCLRAEIALAAAQIAAVKAKAQREQAWLNYFRYLEDAEALETR